MVSKREFRQQYKEENERTKEESFFEAVPELEETCGDLKGLIETVSGLCNCTGLNIAQGSMSPRTAKAVSESYLVDSSSFKNTFRTSSRIIFVKSKSNLFN